MFEETEQKRVISLEDSPSSRRHRKTEKDEDEELLKDEADESNEITSFTESPSSALKKFEFQYIVIDEAHRIKNENSMLSQIVRIFQSKNRLLITGTPLQNNLHELWALLNFLLPDLFSSSDDFDSWFESQDGDQDKVVQQLHKVLRPFLLRRIKSDVEKSLLPKKEVNIYVGMSTMQRKWYQRILEKDIAAVNGALGKGESKTRLLNIVMQLRKCCNHPYLFDGAEPGPPYTNDVHIIENSGKMIVLDKLLKRLKAQGSRVLLFSQMSRVLDILEDYCIFKNYEKVLERAAQKLRLDQLVIQQGRANHAQKNATKEELLSMIQHGAEKIFSSADSTVSDNDIDYILRKGEEKTAELNQKFQSLGLDDLQKFTSDSSSSYEWQGENWVNKRKGENSRGFNWIEPPKRERKANYAIDSYYREALRVTSKPAQPKVPKIPKQITFAEFQFYPPRLVELLKKENYHQHKLMNFKVPLAEPLPQNDNPELRESERQEEQDKIDNAEPLTGEEEAEKNSLMKKAFEDWSKRDFNNFITASAKYGRTAIEEIAEEIEKSLDDVKKYAKVFWERYKELPNYEELIAKIERSEQKMQQTQEIQELIKSKVAQYKNSSYDIQLSSQNKGKSLFTDEEDRYLLMALAKYGYGTEGVYEKIRNEIESSECFRFNWFIKSRAAGELGRRCSTLINMK
ncbi:5854_t:CDS:10 [Entrophospora sp. SA101]|nr:5854_t:CDS:10 [Entrophospora sp. SA101]